MSSGGLEESAVPAPLVALVVLLLNDTNIMFLCLRRMTLSKQKTLIYFLFFSLLGYFTHTIREWMSPFDDRLISVTEKLDHISVSNDSLRGDRGNIILSAICVQKSKCII